MTSIADCPISPTTSLTFATAAHPLTAIEAGTAASAIVEGTLGTIAEADPASAVAVPNCTSVKTGLLAALGIAAVASDCLGFDTNSRLAIAISSGRSVVGRSFLGWAMEAWVRVH